MTRQKIWRAARLAFGGFMVALGVLGLFLPVLQGMLFLAIGLTILARESPRTRGVLLRLRGRIPDRIIRHIEGLRHGRPHDAG